MEATDTTDELEFKRYDFDPLGDETTRESFFWPPSASMRKSSIMKKPGSPGRCTSKIKLYDGAFPQY